jgi:hypothetical protein
VNASKLPDDLVGWHVKVPNESNHLRGWWVKVLEQRDRFIRVGGNVSAGSPWWTERSAIMESAAPAAPGTARPFNGFRPGDIARLIRTIVEPSGDFPGTFRGWKGDKVIVRSVFGVTPEEIEPL